LIRFELAFTYPKLGLGIRRGDDASARKERHFGPYTLVTFCYQSVYK